MDSTKLGFGAMVDGMAGYWKPIRERARKETFELVRLDQPGRILVWMLLLIGAGISALPDWEHVTIRVLAVVGATAIAGLLVYVAKLIRIPPRLAAEAAAKAYELQAMSAAPTRDPRYDFALSVTAQAYSTAVGRNPVPMEWQLIIKNNSNLPVEAQPMRVSQKLKGTEQQDFSCSAAFVRANSEVFYSFKTHEFLWVRDGEILLDIELRYGPPNALPTRLLRKSMRVNYEYLNALTNSNCTTTAELEDAI